MAQNWGGEMRLVRIADLRHCLIAAFETLELGLASQEPAAAAERYQLEVYRLFIS